MADKVSTSNSYTDSELLALVREAIAQVLVGGQEYEIFNCKFTAADLYEIEERLKARVAGESSPGPVFNQLHLDRP